MDGRSGMRAADADREATAERLRVALEEGRLDLHEYDARLVRAYGAKTYADLDEVVADLPGPAPAQRAAVAPAPPAPPPVAEGGPVVETGGAGAGCSASGPRGSGSPGSWSRSGCSSRSAPGTWPISGRPGCSVRGARCY
ncbi:DUF1707 domain-containing protein [Micromonospora sp. NPDC023966]|uniref:DUF1707 SHOCT-like domain-containing protein n=1 Tax=Micromonospora sp. NPDC023966 TaxID=3154699 RepID=UPI00340A2173